MPLHEAAIIAVYYIALTALVFFGAHRLALTFAYWRRGEEPNATLPDDRLPRVTVQLPMYNERYVAERLIRAAAALDYPRDRLEIQVLDDSTDDSIHIVDTVVDELQAQGVPIHCIRRDKRTGYKAGALELGLEQARGEFIAIFDADFVPPPDFLKRAVPHFDAPEVGMVQARWEHLNRDTNLLTRAQAVLLDGHFVVEQSARARAGRFFNFNGTAGLWRRTAIDDAGGWEHDTITEDLDLSYRAQLRGWRFVYVAAITAPAEVPANISAFKSQQHRWAKGSIETLKKLGPVLLRSKLPAAVKTEAFVHLTANMSYLLMVLVAITMPLATLFRQDLDAPLGLMLDLPLFVIGTLSVTAFYVTAQRRRGTSYLTALCMLPLVIAVDIGLSVHKSRAVIEALAGHQTGFVRTPKSAIVHRSDRKKKNSYIKRGFRGGIIELSLAAWLLASTVLLFASPFPSWQPLPFLFLFFIGYAYVGTISLLHALPQRHRAVLPAETNA